MTERRTGRLYNYFIMIMKFIIKYHSAIASHLIPLIEKKILRILDRHIKDRSASDSEESKVRTPIFFTSNAFTSMTLFL